MPEWGGLLRNYYYFIRESRGESRYSRAKRRKYYRYIEKEKIRLVTLGFDNELIRLYCRFLSNTRNINAQRRFEYYFIQESFDFSSEYPNNQLIKACSL